jgi:hypothetical protein
LQSGATDWHCIAASCRYRQLLTVFRMRPRQTAVTYRPCLAQLKNTMPQASCCHAHLLWHASIVQVPSLQVPPPPAPSLPRLKTTHTQLTVQLPAVPSSHPLPAGTHGLPQTHCGGGGLGGGGGQTQRDSTEQSVSQTSSPQYDSIRPHTLYSGCLGIPSSWHTAACLHSCRPSCCTRHTATVHTSRLHRSRPPSPA